jgi:cation transport ATPase
MHMSPFEVAMLVCFGAAWPASIYRSWTSRTVAGKSLVFLVIVFAGYVAGIMHKVFYNPDLVLWLYALNALMVLVDIGLYLRNRALPPAMRD